MSISARAFVTGLPLAAFCIVQMGALARAEDSAGAPVMYTKAPPSDAVSSGQSGGGVMMPIPQLPTIAPYGDVTIAGTGLAVTNGFSNRAVADFAANWYYSGLGLHVDTSRDWREENADYIVAGVSYAITPYIRPKFLYGTSSENLGIQPKTYLRGEIEFQMPSVPGTTGIVATPSITSREYRNGVRETVPEIDVAFYHPEFANHTYFVSEVKATTIMVETISALGYEFSGSETYVIPKWGTIGAEVFGGRMVYDVTLCAMLCSVQNRFLGIRPLVSFYLNHSDAHELFVRGEVVATDFYNIYGGTVGLKTKF
jgi:hypothetical protein